MYVYTVCMNVCIYLCTYESRCMYVHIYNMYECSMNVLKLFILNTFYVQLQFYV